MSSRDLRLLHIESTSRSVEFTLFRPSAIADCPSCLWLMCGTISDTNDWIRRPSDITVRPCDEHLQMLNATLSYPAMSQSRR